MSDPTENVRKELVNAINAEPNSREALEIKYGQVWSTEELRRDFEVLGFSAPLVLVERKSDGVTGSLMFQHSPRYYFTWKEHELDPTLP
jgi:hypothetical protein